MSKKFWADFWQLFKGYWISDEKWKARGLLSAVIALNFAAVYILVLLNQWYNTFYNALQDYNYEAFWPLVGRFALLAFFHIAIAVYAIYLRQMVEIKWRTWMTRRYLAHWMDKQTYYKLQILDYDTDNPDQRISEDINQFVSLTLQLALGFLKQTATLGAFIMVLWDLSGIIKVPFGGYEFTIYGYMVWLSLIYAIVGTYLTHRVGRELIHLNYDQQRYEADFRFNMVRVRENGESIAFYRGEEPEKAGFLERFAKVIKNYWSLMRREKTLTWFTAGYGQLAVIFPLLFATPRYFAKEMALGGLMQTTSAFGRVQDALSFFVDAYTSVAQWLAVVKRLVGFTEHMQLVENVQSDLQFKKNGQVIAIEDLTVDLPSGQALLKNCSFVLKQGDKLLITGASGCGKSTLMRTIAGIWPFGKGNITIPLGTSRLFLPQRPYLPLGNLRTVLFYPEKNIAVSDHEIQNVLQLCQLGQLINRLDVVEDWSRILSLGEQQRIAFARVLLIRPDWTFLDEASSALDEATEKIMYQLLAENLPQMVMVSIGHRDTLKQHHQTKLHLTGDGAFVLEPI